MAALELVGVGKQYPGGQLAVRDASFDVADGELLVLVGPSGCGKSTLLRMIAGLESITTGTLKIGDRIVNDVPPSDRDIAMVFQNYALYPHMTVAENLGFGLKLRGHTREQVAARVNEAAATLELEPLLARKPAALSGGQRQRVALGRALVRKPQVFLLDEPLSNLDAKLRMSMRVEIARLHRQLGTTMVYVTHDQIEAMTLGQRIVVLKDGQIQQIDTPMALYERPANLFVAGFMGSPAMNLLCGRLERVADGDGLVLALPEGGRLPLGVADAAGQWVGRELVAGIRPENLQLGDGEASFDVDVEVVEPVGNEVFVNLRLGPHALIARFGPRPLPVAGGTIRIAVESEHLHFFDADTGERLIATA